MTLRNFLNCAAAMLVEDFQRFGQDIVSAVEKVNSLGMETEEAPAEDVAAKNAASLRQLDQMMAGVGGGSHL